MKTFNLTISRGEFQGEFFTISKTPSLVGRSDKAARLHPEIDLTKADSAAKVSRRHANLYILETGVEVEDLGSLNGSSILHNGTLSQIPSGERAIAKVGDEIIFGEVVLKLSEA